MTDTRYDATNHYFPHERLLAYQLAEQALVFVAARKDTLHGPCGGMAGQLTRACAGAASNTCAGAAAKGDEAKRHFKIALSEAGEAGGCAQIAWRLGAFSDEEHAHLRALLMRCCACLRWLIG
jgi:four helix bundle protein